MKIYLDNCSLQRPFDDRRQVRIAVEAEAILTITSLVETDVVKLVSSDTLLFEVRQSPPKASRKYALELLAHSAAQVVLNEDIVQRARELMSEGIKPLDALHLASAEAAEVDYFCTCDDRLLRRAKRIPLLKLRVVSPLELAEELSK